MEMFELRYFLEVSHFENIHRASERLRISPASLSKAIQRLEEELSVTLFDRQGRNIHLTDHGKLLQRRASEILRLEESARVELTGQKSGLHVIVSGPEVLLASAGNYLIDTIQKKIPRASFEFNAVSELTAIEQLHSGQSHLAILTSDTSELKGLSVSQWREAKFLTCVGKGHPLWSLAQNNKAVPIETVLAHPFVGPSSALLGRVGLKQALDGWRDDEFPRQIAYLTGSLKVLEELVTSGKAIAYLPDYLCDQLPVKILRITGCPYTCTQKIKFAARNPKDHSWLTSLF